MTFKARSKTLLFSFSILCIIFIIVYSIGRGWGGERLKAGKVVNQARPKAIAQTQKKEQTLSGDSLAEQNSKQILFGDLHVHTTYSLDAFALSLPLTSGEGAHPPADACNFARYCSVLDFWSTNEHAEGLTNWQWMQVKESIRQCNVAAGDEENPDMVSFLGWEWTQVGSSPKNHYGHKNVIFLDTAEDKVPTRPIASFPPAGSPARQFQKGMPLAVRAGLAIWAPNGNRELYLDFNKFLSDRSDLQKCEEGKSERELPSDCYETAEKPSDLFKKLDDWGFDVLVIPHGTAWGFYTPPGTTFAKQLVGMMHDESKQLLFEVFSGHGNSEQYKDWRAVKFDKAGKAYCPEPTKSYLPSCWRAGEIIYSRCKKDAVNKAECKEREIKARQDYVNAGLTGHLTTPGTKAGEWLDSGQCKDCILPAFNYRPGNSAQFTMAISNFDDPKKTRHFKFGFMASSDNHFARPGTGYKDYARKGNSESVTKGVPEKVRPLTFPPSSTAKSYSVGFDATTTNLQPLHFLETERQSSFFSTGGLIAVHSQGRSRQEIWRAMQRKEVYGTSGDRMLLWMHLENSPNGKRSPMGSSVSMRHTPRFSVKAVGAWKQKPGCPSYSVNALGPNEIENICKGECYNPSDERKLIIKIEIIKITPQSYKGEKIQGLVHDPWRTHLCKPDARGCSFFFADSEYVKEGRDAYYYARIIEENNDTINGNNLNCEYDDNGKCIKTRPCDVNSKDNCLAQTPELGWTSPIFLEF